MHTKSQFGLPRLFALVTFLCVLPGALALAQEAKWRPLAARFANEPLRWGGDAEGGSAVRASRSR